VVDREPQCMLLARRTPGLHNLVLRVHECIEIVALYLVSDRFQQLRLFHLSRDLDRYVNYTFVKFWEAKLRQNYLESRSVTILENSSE
jgi:hypothetical protein